MADEGVESGGEGADFWRGHIRAWRRSEISRAAYCREHGLAAPRHCRAASVAAEGQGCAGYGGTKEASVVKRKVACVWPARRSAGFGPGDRGDGPGARLRRPALQHDCGQGVSVVGAAPGMKTPSAAWPS